MRHDGVINGKWVLSSNDERWQCHDCYDSKEEAIAAADLDDRYVGQAFFLKEEEVADHAMNWIEEDLDLRVTEQDEWSWREAPVFEPSKEKLAELRAFLERWLTGTLATVWRVMNSEEIVKEKP